MPITGTDSDQPVPFGSTPGDGRRPHAVITCRVCGRRQDVALTNAILLCADCCADPHAALTRVRMQQQRADAELDVAWHSFRAGVAATPVRDQQRYRSLIGTLAGLFTRRRDDPVVAGRIWRAWITASSADDGLARILTAERVLWEAIWCVRTQRIHLARAYDECLLALDLWNNH